jgi:hypothetical protein
VVVVVCMPICIATVLLVSMLKVKLTTPKVEIPDGSQFNFSIWVKGFIFIFFYPIFFWYLSKYQYLVVGKLTLAI